ncbi:hypothetical protein V5O48_015788 [Marasmius crinis-equi]|uniref:DUF6535 domain-containing protein n=1 Tax=Marasmius crinis-equi TaxID=585013 RepID=A0ABR3ETI8_9AGAR
MSTANYHRDPVESQRGSKSSTEPSLEKSWGVVMEQVEKMDREMCENWTNDIDTLLVFAGLLSAVVTAFTIESYQWLSEDPADVTIALLTQISQQLSQPSSPLPTTQSQSFHPSPSAVRINCFWFLGLILSLATSLLALLCKQWLHENQRDAPTQTPKAALALRQMRHDSLKKGGVRVLLVTLPILLELALLSFFVGLLDLFWSLDVMPLFVVGCTLIGASGLIYFVTTFIPGLTITPMIAREMLGSKMMVGSADRLQFYRWTWPYKSPQAWAFFKFTAFLVSTFPSLLPGAWKKPKPVVQILKLSMSAVLPLYNTWSLTDHLLLESWSPKNKDIDIHLWEGIKYVRSMPRDPVSLEPYLRTIFDSFSPTIAYHLGRSDQHRVYTWIDPAVASSDYSGYRYKLGIPPTAEWAAPPDKELILRIVTNSLALEENAQSGQLYANFLNEVRKISRENVPRQTRINFTLFFYVAERLWDGNRGIEMLDIYRAEWHAYSHSDVDKRIIADGDERYQLVACIARHIKARLGCQQPLHPQTTRSIFTTKQGLEFLRFIHNQILEHKLYDTNRYQRFQTFDAHSTLMILNDWVEAMKLVQRVGTLPENFEFVEFPTPGVIAPKSRRLRNIGAFIHNALPWRRAENAPDSQA